MAYNNSMPTISRINLGTRDNDFIPITEMKDFNAKLDEVVSKFNTYLDDTGPSSDAVSIAQKLKEIEYNMCDALVFDKDGNIIGFNSTQDANGNSVPLYGPENIDDMLAKLETYYGEFIALMGSDPNADLWKIPLDEYFTNALTKFRDKINSVFTNSANAAALESKNSNKMDYTKLAAVDFTKNTIMRLNPDLSTYNRSINIFPVRAMTDTVAFEVSEPEKDSLAFNLKFFNGNMYYDFNFVLDKGKWYISRDVKLDGNEDVSKFNYFFNIYKYTSKSSGKVNYVFCLNTDYPSLDTAYSFEIEGVFVGDYSFNATGLDVTEHNEFYTYTIVENDKEPIFNGLYYVKHKDSYIDSETGETSEREVFVEQTHLLKFEDDVTYYERTGNFELSNSVDIINYKFDSGLFADNSGELKTSNDTVVYDNLEYNGGNQLIDVNYEISEAVDGNTNVDANEWVKNNQKVWLDNSIRMYEVDRDTVNLCTRQVSKVDKRLAVGHNDTYFEIVELGPGEIINTNNYINGTVSGSHDNVINKSLYNENVNEYLGVNVSLGVENERVYKTDIINDPSILKKLLVVTADDGTDYTTAINNYIVKNLSFVDYFTIKVYDRADYDKETGKSHSCDVVIYPDFYSDKETISEKNKDYALYRKSGEFYISFTINFADADSDYKCRTLVFRKMVKQEMYMTATENTEELVAPEGDWGDFISMYNIALAINNNGLYYTYAGDIWYHLENPIALNTGKHIKFNNDYIFSYDGEKWLCCFKPDTQDEIYITQDGLHWYQLFGSEEYIDDIGPDHLVNDVDGEYNEKGNYYRIKFARRGLYGFTKYAANKTAAHTMLTDENGLLELIKPKSERSSNTYFYYMFGDESDWYEYSNGNVYGVRSNNRYDNTLISEYVIQNTSTNMQTRYKSGTNKVKSTTIPRNYNPNRNIVFYYPYVYMYGGGGNIYRVNPNTSGWDNIDITGVFGGNTTLNGVNSFSPVYNNDTTSTNCRFICSNKLQSFWYTYTDNAIKDGDLSYFAYFVDNIKARLNYKYHNGTFRASLVDDGSGRTHFYMNTYKYNDYNYLDNILPELTEESWKKRTKYIDSAYMGDISTHYKNMYFGCISNRTNYALNTTPTYGESSGRADCFVIPCVDGKIYYLSNYSYSSYTNFKPARLASKQKITNITEINKDNYVSTVTSKENKAINKNIDNSLVNYFNNRDADVDALLKYFIKPVKTTYKPDFLNETLEYVIANFKSNFHELVYISKNKNGEIKDTGFDTYPEELSNNINVFVFNNVGNIDNIISDEKIYKDGDPIVFVVSEEDKKCGISTFGDVRGSNAKYGIQNLPIIPTDAFETKDGIFMYGYDDTTNKSVVVFHDKNTPLTGNASDFVTVLTTDYIDYIKAHNDDIYISTYDIDNPYDQYLWNPKTHTFDKIAITDVKDLYSFTELFEREDGTLYFINGSGHNPEIPTTNLDVYTFSKIYSTSGTSRPKITKLNPDSILSNGPFTEVINTNHYKSITQFSVDTNIDLICFSKNQQTSPEYFYLIDFTNKTVTDINHDFTTSELINFSSKKFVFDIINIIKNNEDAPLIVQKSAYTAKSVSIESVDKLENIDFRKDEYYLDNKVDTFENNAVKTIYSADTIASGTTISSNDYYLVMKVSDNNELGIFNATYSDIIRVIKGKFIVSAGGYSGEINLDKEYLDIKHLKIGVNNEEATLYMAVYGNYPDVIYNRNTGKLDITYDTYLPKQYKILSIPLSTVVKRETGTNNEMIFYMEDKFEWDKDNEDIRSQMSDFIRNTKHEIEADDVSFRGIVTEDQDKVYFGYEKSVVHKGIYSLIFYDFNRNCLQFYSPITHSTELDKDTSEDDIKNFAKDLDPSKFYKVFSTDSYSKTNMLWNGINKTKQKINMLVEYDKDKLIVENSVIPSSGGKETKLTYDYLNNKTIDRNNTDDMFLGYNRIDISYNNIQTQYGIFRYSCRENINLNTDNYTNYNSTTGENPFFNRYGLSNNLERRYKNYLYFTPEGSNKIITIIPSDGGEIKGVIETVEGLFIYQTARVILNTSMVNGSHLYKMIKIPDTRVSEQICLQDVRYFKEMSIQNNLLTDFRDTVDGLFCLGMEGPGITNIASNVNSKYTGLINIFMYNGDDFIPIATYNPNDTVNGSGRAVYLPLFIIENSTQTLFITDDYNRLAYNPNTGGVTVLSKTPMIAYDYWLFYNSRGINPWCQFYPIAKPIYSEFGSFFFGFAVKKNGQYYVGIYNADKNTWFDVVFDYPEGISESNLPEYLCPTDLIKYPLVRPALDSSAFKDNIYYTKKFLEKLIERGIPVDRRLKAIGHCIFHNERVLINGIEIQSEGGASTEPKNVRFNIDPDYRINDDMAKHISDDGTIENVTDDSFKKANFTIVLPSKIIDDFNNQESEENKYRTETILGPLNVNFDNLRVSREITTRTYDSENKLLYENKTTMNSQATPDIYGIDEFTDTFKFVLQYRDHEDKLVSDTTEYTGNFTEVITGSDAANYNVATTYKYNNKVLKVQNSMDLREKLGFDMTEDGNRMLASLFLGESDESKKARSRCRIGDWVQFKPYNWQKTNGQQFTIRSLRYIVAERILDGHIVFISNDTHSWENGYSLTWTNLITSNMKQSLMLQVVQNQLGVTPKIYTRMSNVPHLTNEYIFFPTEFNVFGAYSYQNNSERPAGERRWPLFDKNKSPNRGVFYRALSANAANTGEPYDDWWLATHTNNSSYPASLVTNPERSDFGVPSDTILDDTNVGCRPCFAL